MENLIKGLAFICLSPLLICSNVCKINGQSLNHNSVVSQAVAPLPFGFAHNDYCHKHPLYDALESGFTNIEADVFLKNGKLIVAHVFPYFKNRRTLESLYLKPLSDRIANNKGLVLAGYTKPVILMIDIKTNAGKTYNALKPLLEKYRQILSGCENGTLINRAVTIVLSGNKPYALLQNEPNRLAFIDEDLRRMPSDSAGNNMFAMASCKYSRLIKWKGKDTMSTIERRKLIVFVTMAHRMGAKVRLWASPEKKVVWNELLNCGVDLINTDQLINFKNYFNTQNVAKVN